MSQNGIVLPTTGAPSGLTMAQDMNLALQDLQSQNSGAQAVATPVAYQRTARTDLGVIKRRNAANTADVLDSSLIETFVVPKSAAFSAALADFERTFICSGSWTLGFAAAAALGDGWYCTIKNIGAGTITLDPSGTETVDGFATLDILTGKACVIYCDGTSFYTIGALSSSSVNQELTSVSVSSNTPTAGLLTLTLQPEVIKFRNSNIANGQPTTRTIAAALSLATTSITASFGLPSGQPGRLTLLAIDDGTATPRLGVVYTGGTLLLDETGLLTSTTAIAGAANSVGVVYTTAALGAGLYPYRVVGAFDIIWTAAAGFSTAPALVTGAGGLALSTTASLSAVGASSVNNIGVAGGAGFGVGICPAVPSGVAPLTGYNNPTNDNYGNYVYSDGSVMAWIPAFYYLEGNGANGFAINWVDVKPESAFASVAAANAAGYALHRAFYDGGLTQRGFFYDKYDCSNNGGIASSIKLGNPISSASVNNPFSGLTGAPANAYYGAFAAAKTRGANFFPNSNFMFAALAMIAQAHALASSSTTWCAWYNATYNFPKGCNNNALGDTNDAALTFIGTGYSTANKAGSANVLAKTTHNGQNCGVADLNGTIYKVAIGITSDGSNFYILKTSATMKNITAGNTLATDAWGATGIAALYDNLGATYGALTASSSLKLLGAATQVFSPATSGNAWNATGAGIPLATGVGGTNQFGSDQLYDYRPNEMCPIVAGYWSDAANAGVGALNLTYVRSTSASIVGLRAALYL